MSMHEASNIWNQKKVIILAVVAAVCIAVAFLACVFLFVMRNMKGYEDLNGTEDTSLNTITTEMVLEKNSSSTIMSYHTYEGGHTKVTGRMKGYDRDRCMFGAKKLDGIMTLQASKSDQQKLTIHINSQLKSGNAEIFIIVDGEIVQRISGLLPEEKRYYVELQDIGGKTVLVKLAGESAEIDISVTREYS